MHITTCVASRCNICAPQSLSDWQRPAVGSSSQLSGRNQEGAGGLGLRGGGPHPILYCAHSGTPISSQIRSINGTGMKCNVGGGSFSHFSEEARKQKGRGINESMQDTRWRVEWPLTHGGKLLVGGGTKISLPSSPLACSNTCVLSSYSYAFLICAASTRVCMCSQSHM